MKNISKQYQDLQEGKISKHNFVRSVRMSFPQYVSPSTSIDDAVRILKSKRIISEYKSNSIINEEYQNFSSESSSDTGGIEEDNTTDLFQDMSQVPDQVKNVIDKYEIDGEYSYEDLKKMKDELSKMGYTFEYGLDAIPHDLRKSKAINESTTNSGYTYLKEPISVPEIDMTNPYQLKKGFEFELSKMKDISGDAYKIALDKAVKSIIKNKDAYKDLQIANYKEVKKYDETLQTKEVGKKSKTESKIKGDGYLKKELVKKEKENVTSSKKENKTGKPEGVKEMSNTPKKAKGISKTMEIPGKEQVLNELRSLKKKDRLSEDLHYKYTIGAEVNTPDGMGIVNNIVGGTISVQLQNGKISDYQVNVLDKQAREDYFAKTPNKYRAFQDPMEEKKESKKDSILKKLKEYFTKKKVKEAQDVVKAKTTDGDEEVVATVPAGQGKRKASMYKSQGVTTARSISLK